MEVAVTLLKCSERVCGIVEGGSRHKKQRGGEGEGVGVVCRGYRWAASLDLKRSRDLAATISWSRRFHSGMVRGNNDIIIYVLCPAVGDVVAVCVVLSVARYVF